MILSSKDMINASTWQSKEEPETVYQPTVSMIRNSFFFLGGWGGGGGREKFIFHEIVLNFY